jgi:large subunit ribosomal protein L33
VKERIGKLLAVHFFTRSPVHWLRRRDWKMREIVTLQCTECKERNYSTTKNKKTTTGRLEFKKFCNRCRKHQPHKETK